MLSECFTRS